MSAELDRAAEPDATAQHCAAVVERLAALYEWQLVAGQAEALAHELAQTAACAPGLDERSLEQACCRHYLAALFRAIEAGGDRADRALAELFRVVWFDAPDGGQEVRYGGYLYRAALATLRRQLARYGVVVEDVQQHAADAAVRALTRVQARFRDCRDADAFWGWTARVAERAALDELRSGRATGGSSVHARSLDAAI